MEIKQLEIFACVARTLSFSKAAEKMYVSQPTVSASISSLEKELGVQLLVRNTKEVSLTKTGADFLPYAQRMLSLREQALHSVNVCYKETKGAIDIIASTIPAQHLLPEIIAAFVKEWPNVLFSISQSVSHEVERKMSSFKFDFGMVGTTPDPDRFIYFPVYNDELVLVTPTCQTQSSEAIRENFADYITQTTFLTRESGSGTRAEIEGLFTKLGIDLRKLNIGAYFSDSNSILLAVSRGMGVSLVPKVAASMYIDADFINTVEMKSPLFCRQIYLIYNKELQLSPVQQAFANHVLSFYSS